VRTETALALSHRFGRQVSRLLSVRVSADNAFALGALRRSDIDHIYESTFLDLVSYFEVYLEDLFFSCVLGRSALNDVQPLLTFSARTQAEAVTRGTDRVFSSWSKMKDVMPRAESFLKDGRPFSRLRGRDRDLDVLSSGLRIRNAIAHRSSSAREQFSRLQLVGLAPSRRTPAGYLQQLVGTTSRHETLVNAYGRIANALAAPKLGAAERFLQQESPYDSGQKAPIGEYVCLVCGLTIRGGRSLPRCAGCAPCTTCGRRPTSHFQRVV
jgi:hypothetical protein